MNSLKFKRNYKFLICFLVFFCIFIVFGNTRIISYNFGNYSTAVETSVINIENTTEIFDDSIIHDIYIDITAEDYEDLVLYYKQNSEKEYLKTDITIDGILVSDVGIKLKGNQVVIGDIADIDVEQVVFSFTIKFDEYISGQTYQGQQKISLISGSLESLKGEYIAGELFNNYGVIAPSSSFTSVITSDLLSGTYLIKQVVDEVFLEDNYDDDYGLLYKAENSLSFTYLGEDPTQYTDLFTQKSLVNNYDLKKLIEILEFSSLSGNTSFLDDFTKYIDIENYTKFIAINNILYGENTKLSLLNSYYIYYDLGSQTIKFIPWDSEYINEVEQSSLYEILETVFSKQEITNIGKKDIREILDNFTGSDVSELAKKYINTLEDRFLDEDGFILLYDTVKENIEIDLENNNFITNLELEVNNLFR